MSANEENRRKFRGTALFEEFERVIPYLNGFDERGDLEFIKAVQILLDHFKLSEHEVRVGEKFGAEPIVANLRNLLNAYLKKTMTVPSAIFVVMAFVESAYLEGEDADLVHKLTGLHIERAKSMKPSGINPKSAARTATRSFSAPRPQKNAWLAVLTSGRRAARLLLRQA